jgi:hypothetical protein
MKAYCLTCGSGTEYSLNKPRFCGSCGESFSSLNKQAPKKVFKAAKTVNKAPIIEVEEDEEERFVEPDMDSLAFDLEGNRPDKRNTLEELLGTGGPESADGYQREADPTYSRDSITEDFKRDAGTSRRPNA